METEWALLEYKWIHLIFFQPQEIVFSLISDFMFSSFYIVSIPYILTVTSTEVSSKIFNGTLTPSYKNVQ